MFTAKKREFFIEFGIAPDHSLDYLIGILNDTRTTTILTIQSLSVNELDWQYREGRNTIGALLSHIVAIEEYFRIEYVEGRKLSEKENTELTPALDMGVHIRSLINQQPIDTYIRQLSNSRQSLLESLRKIDFEHFSRRFVSTDYQSDCNLAWALYHMVEDEIYHRGQISLIKKLYQERSHH